MKFRYFLAAAAAVCASPVMAGPIFTPAGPGTSSATYTSPSTVRFDFADNGFNAYSGADRWDFTAVADKTGLYTFSYDVTGYSAFYQAYAFASAFSAGASQQLYNHGTFGGYGDSGTFDLSLVKGQLFGVTLGGGNYDSDARVQGQFSLSSSALAGGVPEPATWALLIAGFGMVGFAMRRRSKQAVRVTYA